MTLNIHISTDLRNNLQISATDPTAWLYVGASHNSSRLVTALSRKLPNRDEPVSVLVDYIVGLCDNTRQSMYSVRDKAELMRYVCEAVERYDGNIQLEIDNQGQCIVSYPDGDAHTVAGSIEIEAAPAMDLPIHPLKHTDDRQDRISFDGVRYAQMTLGLHNGRVLIPMDDPHDRQFFVQCLNVVAPNRKTVVVEIENDRFKAKEDKTMAASQNPAANPQVPQNPAAKPQVKAPSVPTPPRPLGASSAPPVPKGIPKRPAEIEAAVVADLQPEAPEIAGDTVAIPAEATPDAESPAEATEPVQDQEGQDTGESQEAGDAGNQDDGAEQRQRRSRRSSETLDAEAAERLTSRKWVVIPPVADLQERLNKDVAATVKEVAEALSVADAAIRSVRDALVFELAAMCGKPRKEVQLPEADIAKIKSTMALLEALTKQG